MERLVGQAQLRSEKAFAALRLGVLARYFTESGGMNRAKPLRRQDLAIAGKIKVSAK